MSCYRPIGLKNKTGLCRTCNPEGLREAGRRVGLRHGGLEPEEIMTRLGAHRLFPTIEEYECELCPNGAQVRHHKDMDPTNNTRENIMLLCYRCHNFLEGHGAHIRGPRGRFVSGKTRK